MSRTIRDYKINKIQPREIETYIRDWLETSKFKILTENSNGTSFHSREWWQTIGQKISPNKNCLVATKLSPKGLLIFEFMITKEAESLATIVHGEFYAAGVALFMGREWDVKPDPGLLGRWPRKEGYKLMSDFEAQLKSLNSNQTNIIGH